MAAKATSRCGWLVAASLLLPAKYDLPSAAQKRVRALSREDVATVWVGMTEDELDILRLSLAADGTGVGGYAFLDDPPRRFRVTSWNYTPPRAEIAVSPADKKAVGIEALDGAIVGISMRLTIRGQGWSRKCSLRRESDLEPRWERLKSAMTGFESGDVEALAEQLRGAAIEERPFLVDQAMVSRYGDRGFSQIAALLKDPDPRVRAVSATVLFRWNRSASLPFLIALLEDRQTWLPQMKGDLVPAPTTPSEFANAMLSGAFLCDEDARSRVPVDEIGAPGAVDRARQRWYRFHIPFCFVPGEPMLPRYYWYPMAAFFEVPATEIKEVQRSGAANFGQALVASLDVGHRNEPIYRPDEAIPVSLTFLNYGRETLWMRYDQQDTQVHQFELRTANGAPVPLVAEFLAPLPATTPLLQPIYGDYAFGLGPWEFDLAKLFLVPGPGVYRFRYSYVPPQERQSKEYAGVARLRFWNGRAYGDYFEFRVLDTALNMKRE